jgi:tetratricopeptide (TPR) repeat protein
VGVWLACVAVSGCAALIPPPPTPPEQKEVPPAVKKPEEVTPSAPKPNPRAVAALQLREEARSLLVQNKPGDAIRVLEQAVNLNPTGGQNYYYLSEAWLMKGNPGQAREYNNLAASYLENDPEWRGRVQEQRQRIENRRER